MPKAKVGRPKLMKKAIRILVQIDEKDLKELNKLLEISTAQFFRDAVKNKLNENTSAKSINKT